MPVIKVNLKEAEGHLGELIEEAAAGQEVVITSTGGPTVRLMLIPRSEQETQGAASEAVGHTLDHYIGTWSAEQAAEVLQAMQLFEQVDPSFWQ